MHRWQLPRVEHYSARNADHIPLYHLKCGPSLDVFLAQNKQLHMVDFKQCRN
jgi:hypothetical protein